MDAALISLPFCLGGRDLSLCVVVMLWSFASLTNFFLELKILFKTISSWLSVGLFFPPFAFYSVQVSSLTTKN